MLKFSELFFKLPVLMIKFLQLWILIQQGDNRLFFLLCSIRRLLILFFWLRAGLNLTYANGFVNVVFHIAFQQVSLTIAAFALSFRRTQIKRPRVAEIVLRWSDQARLSELRDFGAPPKNIQCSAAMRAARRGNATKLSHKLVRRRRLRVHPSFGRATLQTLNGGYCHRHDAVV